jgi:purine nucleosidase/pyrimidine-specific ribonucleoside hydrolase
MEVVDFYGLNLFMAATANSPSPLLVAYDLVTLMIWIAALVLGVIALASKQERSWMVWVFLLPVVIIAAFLSSIFFGQFRFSNRVGTAPTTGATIQQLPVIFDDDGSPDGTSALLFLLSEPRAKVMAVSVSSGEAHPQVYIQHLGGMLAQYGFEDIPLGAGQDAPLAGGNSFPEGVRKASDGFWGFARESRDQAYPVQDSAELIIDTIKESAEPITLFFTGPLTNLAQALRMEPGIREKVAGVFIMGGAVFVPGNLKGLLPDSENRVAEWNIYADPTAASEVFASGMKLYLVPLDATNQVSLTHKDTSSWRNGGRIPDFAAEIYDSRMAAWGRDEIEMWDLVTAEIMLNPGDCAFKPLRLEVVTAEGNMQGQSRVVDGQANVNVCLKPDGKAIKQRLVEVFSSRK